MRAHLAAIGCNGQEISRAHLAAIGCNGLRVRYFRTEISHESETKSEEEGLGEEAEGGRRGEDTA